MTENIDLAKTFAQIGGTDVPSDGRSLMPLFGGLTPASWRNAVLIEHRGPDLRPYDPDFQQPASGNPTTYEAMRTDEFLYVEYSDGEREVYDLRNDPFELHNLAAYLTPIQLAQLHAELLGLKRCHGGQRCWAAMHVERLSQLGVALRRKRSHFPSPGSVAPGRRHHAHHRRVKRPLRLKRA
jgi:N-acetylglucosamine-6-sulfatase